MPLEGQRWVGTSEPQRLALRLVDESGNARLTPARAAQLMSELARPGRIVTLEGEPGVFCEGLELALVAEGSGHVGEGFARLLAAIDETPRPVVALVDGPALGGGCALAAAADLVLATPRATFGLPEVLWGLIPAVAFAYVTRRLTPARARLLSMGIPALDAAEALRWGLVDAVVPELEAGFATHARRLLRADPRALAEVKALAPYARDPAYLPRAIARLEALAASDETRARIRMLLDGDLPWGEDR